MRNGAKQPRTRLKDQQAATVEPSSGNVFADMGVPRPNVALARAELARRIGNILRERKLTPARAAQVLGIGSARVEALVRGKLEGFTTDRLFRLLNVLGHDIDIVIRRAVPPPGHAETRVVLA